MVGPVSDGRQLARPRRQLALEEIAEALARGVDVLAVKRALSRAGYLRWGNFTPLWGEFAAKAAKKFQQDNGIAPVTGFCLFFPAASVNGGEWGNNCIEKSRFSATLSGVAAE